ncbi:hypothetical protein D3C75_751160 [compost metagenome]
MNPSGSSTLSFELMFPVTPHVLPLYAIPCKLLPSLFQVTLSGVTTRLWDDVVISTIPVPFEAAERIVWFVTESAAVHVAPPFVELYISPALPKRYSSDPACTAPSVLL